MDDDAKRLIEVSLGNDDEWCRAFAELCGVEFKEAIPPASSKEIWEAERMRDQMIAQCPWTANYGLGLLSGAELVHALKTYFSDRWEAKELVSRH